jgi:hypothetical protein
MFSCFLVSYDIRRTCTRTRTVRTYVVVSKSLEFGIVRLLSLRVLQLVADDKIDINPEFDNR